MDFEKKQPIIELYSCIQTEGSKAGIPHILIRTTGCTHRCFFGEGGWCDSWYTSITPEKGSITLKNFSDFIRENSQINHLMITGGSPTMHPELVSDLVKLFKCFHGGDLSTPGYIDTTKSFITLETEGSHFVSTLFPIDLISLSPKFNNSIPVLGTKLPNSDKVVDQKLIDQHNKFRMKFEPISDMLSCHNDYHFKPVVDQKDGSWIWKEIEDFQELHGIPNNKVWVMPAGDQREHLISNYPYVIEECIKRGYNFTGRDHIIAYGDKRGV